MTRREITAAVLVAPGNDLQLQKAFLDEVLPNEVRVRTLAAGLCHSDLHYLNGTLNISLPTVLGHEVIGEVVDVGSDESAHLLGNRVIASITPSCGSCKNCVSGRSSQCLRSADVRKRVRPKLVDAQDNPINLLGAIGGFADEFIIPANAAVPVPKSIPHAEGCLLGCCVVTGFGAVTHGAQVNALDSVAVIGCGGVGIAAIQAAKIAGAKTIIAIDMHQEKLDRAREFGATHGVLSNEQTRELIHAISPGGVDKSFEAVGSPITASLAFSLLAPTGVATILGLEKSGSQINVDAEMLIEGDRKIQGAYMGSNQLLRDVETFAAHFATGALQLTNMVTSRWRFDQINEGFAAMSDPNAIRAVVEW